MKYSRFLLFLLVAILLQTGCAKQNFFTEPPDYPVIDSLSPAAGFVGTQVRLWGSGFSGFTSKDTVRINGVLLRVDSPSTSTVLLTTLIDSTGTGAVTVTVNGKSGTGPVFTYLGGGASAGAPVITGADYGWHDGDGYAVNVKALPATDDGIRVLVGGVNVPIAFVVRPGDPKYDPGKGNQILLGVDSLVHNNADGIYANFMVTYNGVPSNLYAYQLKPLITNISSRHGAYTFAARDTVSLQGNFFGDRNSLPSSIDIRYNGMQLEQPAILSWSNKEIKAVIPVYSQVSNDASIPIAVKVGSKENDFAYCRYLGVVADTTHSIYTKIEYSGTSSFSEARKYLAAAGAGSRIIFAGGANTSYSYTADIYNVTTGVWTTGYLSEARFNLAAASAGSKIVFAGGNGPNGRSGRVDIYDTSTLAWTTAQLSVPRDELCAVGAGNKIYFAGGSAGGGPGVSSKVVDIYDVTNNSWTTAELSEPRAGLAAATAGNKVVFAGGHNSATGADSKTADILDISTNSWSVTTLNGGARTQLAGYGVGNSIVFGGGISSPTGAYVKTVDVYDITTNTWNTDQLSVARANIAIAGGGNKIVFAGGFGTGTQYKSNTYDIYDVVNKTWVSGQLSEGKGGMAGAAAGNKIMFGGGETNTAVGVTNTVEIFTLSN